MGRGLGIPSQQRHRAMQTIVQGLWIGEALSVMEQLSIGSYLAHGHAYHLYVYDEVQHVPEGVVVRDGNEILPASMIFQYKHYQSYAGFANYFRYKLLLERGGWWADMDTVCIRPFDFDEAYVFASETYGANQYVASATIKAPAGSAVMAYAWDVCRAKDPQTLAWGETGPRLMSEAVPACGLEAYVRRPEVFCPVACEAWETVLDPEMTWPFDDATYAVHLWHEMWRDAGQDKHGPFPTGCLYEQLKRRYLSE